MEKKARQKNKENALPPRQAEILSFIKDTLETMGTPPSYREIQRHFKFKAIKTVQDHLKALTKKGALVSSVSKKNKRFSRNLVPHNHRFEKVRRLPIYGEVAAGSPRDAEQLELGSLLVEESRAPLQSFALRVVGNSMVEAGILEGDILIVEKTSQARNGDIVVALLNGEPTVKRFRKERGTLWLIPENRQMHPILVGNQHLEIQGKVVGLQRHYSN